MSTADDVVRRHVRHRLTFGDASVVPQSWERDKAAVLRAERAALVARLTDLEDLWADGEFSTANYKRKRAEITETIDGLTGRLDEIESCDAFASLLGEVTDSVIARGTGITQRFDALNLDQRRLIVASLLPTITVTPGRGAGRIRLYLPDGREHRITDGDQGEGQ